MAQGSKSTEREERKAAEVQLFVQRYSRKVRPGSLDPNDRKYDRRVENIVKRMKPEQLDALLRSGDEE